jgi:DNA-binding Xre family transcriptional regulator
MNKKVKSTYDQFCKSLSSKEKKKFEAEYKDLLFLEMLIALMEQADISVRKLAQAAGISPTVVQGLRSGKRKNVSLQSFSKILTVLGCSLVAEKNGTRFHLDLSYSNKR